MDLEFDPIREQLALRWHSGGVSCQQAIGLTTTGPNFGGRTRSISRASIVQTHAPPCALLAVLRRAERAITASGSGRAHGAPSASSGLSGAFPLWPHTSTREPAQHRPGTLGARLGRRRALNLVEARLAPPRSD